MSELSDFFEAMLPSNLANVVRRNKDIIDVRLITEDEIQAIVGTVSDDIGCARGTISRWDLVVLLRSGKLWSVHLLGFRENGQTWITSPVKALDTERGVAKTANSLYALGNAATEEPGMDLSLMVTQALVSWRLNDRYDLGINLTFG